MDTHAFNIDASGRVTTIGSNIGPNVWLIVKRGPFMVWHIPGYKLNYGIGANDFLCTRYILLEEYEHYYPMSNNTGIRARVIKESESGGRSVRRAFIQLAEEHAAKSAGNV